MAHRGQPRFLTRQDRVLAGQKRILTPASPAAGADWQLTVPGGREWRLDAFRAILTTSAVVANRFPRLQLTDGSVTYWESGQETALVASGAYRISGSVLGPSLQSGTAAVPSQVSLPDLWVPGSHSLIISTLGLDAGDQWSAVVVMAEERFIDDQKLSDNHLEHERRETAEREQGQPAPMRY